MGIADQFKDKAQELADQAKQQKAGGKRDEARRAFLGPPGPCLGAGAGPSARRP